MIIIHHTPHHTSVASRHGAWPRFMDDGSLLIHTWFCIVLLRPPVVTGRWTYHLTYPGVPSITETIFLTVAE